MKAQPGRSWSVCALNCVRVDQTQIVCLSVYLTPYSEYRGPEYYNFSVTTIKQLHDCDCESVSTIDPTREIDDMLDTNVESIASETPTRKASDIRAGEAEAAREPGGRTDQSPRSAEPTTHQEDKPRRAGPWPHENPRAARTPHKKLRLPVTPVPMLHQQSCAAGPMPHTGTWFKGQGATTHKNHQHPWPAVGHTPQSHKNLRPTRLPLQNLERPRWVSSPRCASADPRPTREPTPCTPPIPGKRAEQNRVDRETGLKGPSLVVDTPITGGEAPGGWLHAGAGLPPGFPFHVRTLPLQQRASTVVTSVALPPIVPHSGGDAVKSSYVPCGVVRGDLVYTRDSTRGIVLVRR